MNILRTGFEKLVSLKNSFLVLSPVKKLIIIAIIIGTGWFSVPRILGNQTQEPQYQTAQAEKGTLITSVSTSGTVSQGSSVSITSSATGIVQEVYVRNGDTVSEGNPITLIKLDKNSQQQQIQAWASYLSAQNNLNLAKTKMNSLQASLFEANQDFVTGTGAQDSGVAKDDPQYIIENAKWLQAEADYNNQANVINQAEAALSSAWLSYSQLSPTITAPLSGVVSNLNITTGLTISGSSQSSSSTNGSTTSSNSSSAQTIGRITLEDGMPQVTVNLTEIDVVKVKAGQKATLTLDALPDRTFTGKVLAVNTNGSVSSGVTTYPTTITFDTAVETIYPNMAVNATIITDIKNNVVLVPSGAVQTANGQSTVRVIRNGQVTLVSIEVGETNDTQSEIISGVNEGDTIVTGRTNTTPGSTGASSPFGGTGFGGRGGGFSAPAGGGGMIIDDMAAIIQAKNLSKIYKTEVMETVALSDVSFEIKKGEFVAIMGPSGSGKSTLMHIIGALDTPSSGTYTLDGEEVQKLTDDELSDIRNRKIGFIFQAYNLLPRTSALKNVMLPMRYAGIPLKERQDRAEKYLKLVRLGDRINHSSNQLSGGQQQRVAIARGLAMNPTILLADEPTGNLPSNQTEEIMGIFQDLNDEGHTIIVITHEETVAQHTKRIIQIRDGKIVDDLINKKQRRVKI